MGQASIRRFDSAYTHPQAHLKKAQKKRCHTHRSPFQLKSFQPQSLKPKVSTEA